jgi:AcrR family transcriptional regulator
VAILEAAADLLVERGLAAVSIEAIAARAGVSKVTIYKWWASRGAVAVDAYFRRYQQTLEFDDTGDLARDLAGQIRRLIEAFGERAGVVMAELIGQAQTDRELAEVLRARWLEPRREASTVILHRAIARGEIHSDCNIPAVLDQLYAPIYYRLMMRHEPLDVGLADTVIAIVLDGIRRR